MRNCFLSAVLFASISVSSQELALSQGVGVTMENLSTLAQTSLPLSVARTGQRSVGDPVVRAFLHSEDTGVVYSLSERMKLYATRYSSRDLIGSWSLEPYSEHLKIGGEDSLATEAIAAAYGEQFNRTDTLAIVPDYEPSYFMSPGDLKDRVGCMEANPLRYGDINEDAQQELVLTIGKDFVVFSPQKKSVIFSAHYYLSDELSQEEAQNSGLTNNKSSDPAYIAYSTLEVKDRRVLYPALRSISKLYFGGFESSQSRDIVLWRKLYQSKLVNDPVPGFFKIGELLVHYKLIDGEYKKQDTESSVVKGWLTAKQLTWQKGYPSKSECPGQTDQLIPEMHDPLLNDPDVLQ